MNDFSSCFRCVARRATRAKEKSGDVTTSDDDVWSWSLSFMASISSSRLAYHRVTTSTQTAITCSQCLSTSSKAEPARALAVIPDRRPLAQRARPELIRC